MKTTKILGIGILGVSIIAMGAGCISGQYKKQVEVLKQENWELSQKNAKLEGDIVQWNRRCELLLQELSDNAGENETLPEKSIIIKNEDSALTKKLKSKGFAVITRDNNPTVVISDLFDPGAVSLSDNGEKKLKETGKIIKADAQNAYLKIDGYTDNTPIQKSVKYKSNEELSLARAEAVKDFLVKKCEFTADNISVNGLGEKNPIADNKKPDGKKKNRRVEIIVIVK